VAAAGVAVAELAEVTVAAELAEAVERTPADEAG
jgi:hypothetical protein